MNEVTRILRRIEQGDASAAEQLLPLVYQELRRLAASKLRKEKPGNTLVATALVHEAYLRLVGSEQHRHWNDSAHFFRTAAEAMRCILVDSARRKHSLKRGRGAARFEVGVADGARPFAMEDILSINEVLDKLAQHDAEKAELVKLRYFAGLPLKEAAKVLGISRATASRHWGYAKTWMYCELTRDRQ